MTYNSTYEAPSAGMTEGAELILEHDAKGQLRNEKLMRFCF